MRWKVKALGGAWERGGGDWQLGVTPNRPRGRLRPLGRSSMGDTRRNQVLHGHLDRLRRPPRDLTEPNVMQLPVRGIDRWYG
ncbi:MAG: hypothetical protein GY842_25120 [bacterium]|nr:hypothetical protein [bacterium]